MKKELLMAGCILLITGGAAIGVSVGNGWYRGYLAWGGNKNSYGSDIALLFQLAITYTDETTELLLSDEHWKSSTGPTILPPVFWARLISAMYCTSSWTISGNELTLDVEIPANTTADIYIPAASATAITESGKAITGQKNIPVTGTADQYVVIKAGSGKYHFVTAAPAKTN